MICETQTTIDDPLHRGQLASAARSLAGAWNKQWQKQKDRQRKKQIPFGDDKQEKRDDEMPSERATR